MKFSLISSLALALAGTASAAVIVPVSVSSTGTANEPGDAGTSLSALIDGTGITGTSADNATGGGATHSGALANYWVTTNPTGAPDSNDYFADVSGTLQLDFDLDGAYDVTRILFWGYDPGFGADATENTPTDITVSYSTNGTTFGSDQTINPVIGSGPAQSFTVSGAPSGTTHVRFLINDNGHDGSGPGGDRVGFGEVRFGGTAVPEPSSTLLLGLGGLSLVLRRRR